MLFELEQCIYSCDTAPFYRVYSPRSLGLFIFIFMYRFNRDISGEEMTWNLTVSYYGVNSDSSPLFKRYYLVNLSSTKYWN